MLYLSHCGELVHLTKTFKVVIFISYNAKRKRIVKEIYKKRFTVQFMHFIYKPARKNQTLLTD